MFCSAKMKKSSWMYWTKTSFRHSSAISFGFVISPKQCYANGFFLFNEEVRSRMDLRFSKFFLIMMLHFGTCKKNNICDLYIETSPTFWKLVEEVYSPITTIFSKILLAYLVLDIHWYQQRHCMSQSANTYVHGEKHDRC